MNANHRVGITGMGVVASIGDDIHSFTHALKNGMSGIRRMEYRREPQLLVGIGADLPRFDFMRGLNRLDQKLTKSKLHIAGRLGRRAPLPIQTTILSALEAWRDAGLEAADPNDALHIPERTGLIIAGQNTTHGLQYDQFSRFMAHPEYLSPRCALEFMETNQVGVLSELFNIHGEGFVVGGASATGNVAVIKALQAIGQGALDICMVVGVLADLSPMELQAYINIGAMGGQSFHDQPDKACRPFDRLHEGFIYGQAGACIILESEKSALRRGIAFHAQIKGGALILDGNSGADPNINGEIKTMLNALDQSGLAPSDIDYLNTHGSSSPLGDHTEAKAIHQVFGDCDCNLWLNSTKSLTGHCLYSAGIVELIATVQQMRHAFVHPNLNLEEPIHKALRFNGRKAIAHRIVNAMSNSFGFGGINTCVVLQRTT